MQGEADLWKPTALTIDSHITGEHLELCTSRRSDPDGRFRFLWTLWPGKTGPNEHHHTDEAETITIVAGTLRVWLNGVVRDYGPGEVIDIPAHTKHKFLNATQAPVVARVAFTGTQMEDTFVPAAVAMSNGARELTAMARMTVFLARHRPTRPTARWEVIAVRVVAALFRLAGVRAHEPVYGWDARRA